jgi:Tubulin domain
LQALQLFTSLNDSWGGFSSAYAETLHDEFPKTCLWVWGIADTPGAPQGLKARWEHMINRAQSVTVFAGTASMLVPVTVPRVLPDSVNLQPEAQWHTSALLCGGIESITLPTRMKSEDGLPPPRLGEWEAMLCDAGRRRVAALKYGIIPQQDSTPAKERDQRMAGGVENEDDPSHLEEKLNAGLDIDLFPHSASDVEQRGGRRLGQREKTFTRIDCYRTSQPEYIPSLDEELAYRFNGPTIKQFVPLLFLVSLN